MAKRLLLLEFVFLTLCAFCHGLSILHGTIQCRNVCQRSFPPHTYPGNEQYLACQQGCYRALKIDGWSECSGCKTNFAKQEDIDACNLGCNNGHRIIADNKNVPDPSQKPTAPAAKEQQNTVATMILHPVMLLRSYGFGVINKLTYYVQSSTSYYFSTSKGDMLVVNIEDEPKVYVQNGNQIQSEMYDQQEDKGDKEPRGYNINGHHESWIFVRKSHHWLHCVSHRSGVPMWILTSILFLSSFFLLWLCCASTSTAPSTKVSTRKAFVIKDFLSKDKDGHDVPLLNLDEEEAKPLPSKAAIIDI